MIEPAPPWISLLLGRVGLAAIVVLETIWAGLLLTNNSASWDSRFWGSFLPLVTMAGIALLVGMACLWEYRHTSRPYRHLRMFRPFLWCLAFTAASIPVMYAAVLISYGLYV